MNAAATAGDWLGLAGSVCVVTGAGNGIGAETARQLAWAGALVAVLDRDEDAAAHVASGINRQGLRALGLRCDVSLAPDVQAAADRVLAELGPCRVLINNAAARHRAPVLDTRQDAWNHILGVNLGGPLLCSQAFSRQMIDAGHGGSIVHVGSILGRHPQVDAAAYCASKAGLVMLSKSLSLELAAHRIRSNVVSPGFTHTPANAASYQDHEVMAARERLIPSGRIATPADLADVILMLASDRTGYVNGEDLLVDGGVENTLVGRVPRAAATR